jgi:hypothetical protein
VDIILTQNQVTTIDDEDYELASKYKWHAVKEPSGYYAYSHFYREGKRTTIQLHRLIMKAEKGQQIDHINGNTLDNRKENLRFCDYSQNQQNKKQTRGTSKYKGVSLFKETGKWKASIGVDRKNYHIGYFDSEEEAAKAYDKKTKELFKEFASLNFIGTHLYKKDV